MPLGPNNSLLLWYLLLSSFILPATNEVGMTYPILQMKKLKAWDFLRPTKAIAGGNREPGFEFLSFWIQSVQSKVHKNRFFVSLIFELLLSEILIKSIFDKNAIHSILIFEDLLFGN